MPPLFQNMRFLVKKFDIFGLGSAYLGNIFSFIVSSLFQKLLTI